MRKVLALFIALTVLTGFVANADAKRVIITFKAGTASAVRAKALEGLKAKEVSTIESTDQEKLFIAVVAEVQGTAQTAKVLGAFDGTGSGSVSLEDPSIASVEEDYKVKWIETAPATLGATPFINGGAALGAFGLKSFKASGPGVFAAASARSPYPWGIKRVKAPSAWDYTQGEKVRVAIIDTGIDLRHGALQGKIDGGFNAITDSEADGAYQDDNGHGTHVAGTVAANSPDKLFGVAPKARLYAVKVLDAEGSGSLSNVVKGIVWAANNGMQVANMSLGSPMPSDTMQRALRYAKGRGVVVVAAAGNSGGAVGYPGAYPETIAVAASDWNDKIAAFSSRGPQVKFIAPGVSVLSSMMGGDFATLSGTSMAAPHVTGLAALAVAQGFRGLDGPDGVLAQLQKAAKKIDGLSAEEQGLGMIDAGKLVR
ncbi:MAG: S8 family serine peptidase [Elusimicrobia bacterium]|nr:S8 family serine peptidase [Elusimicrobiota bacterium]